MSAPCCSTADGLVFVARRADMPNAEGPAGGWQLPQGGIDEGEDPRTAVLRELEEEIGTRKAEVIGEHPDWLTYDLPPTCVGIAWRGRYRGQRQRWFAMRFIGQGQRYPPRSGPSSGVRCLALGAVGRAAGSGGAIQARDLRRADEILRAIRRPITEGRYSRCRRRERRNVASPLRILRRRVRSGNGPGRHDLTGSG